MKRLITLAIAFGALVAVAAAVGLTSGTASAAVTLTTSQAAATEFLPFCVGGEDWSFSSEDAAVVSDWISNGWTIYVNPGDEYITLNPQAEDGMRPVAVTEGACAMPAPVVIPAEPSRIAYCSVSGNTLPNGTPLVGGTFLNLLAGQPGTDAHYTGAAPAFWVEGVGLTCSLTPAQAALASASLVKVGGGGEVLPPALGGIYTFIPQK